MNTRKSRPPPPPTKPKTLRASATASVQDELDAIRTSQVGGIKARIAALGLEQSQQTGDPPASAPGDAVIKPFSVKSALSVETARSAGGPSTHGANRYSVSALKHVRNSPLGDIHLGETRAMSNSTVEQSQVSTPTETTARRSSLELPSTANIDSLSIPQVRLRPRKNTLPSKAIANKAMSDRSSSASSIHLNNNIINSTNFTISPPQMHRALESRETAASTTGSAPSITSYDSGTTKREKIIQELLETERRYFEDLCVLRNVYVQPAIHRQILPLTDIKLMFGDIDLLIQVSGQVLEVLGVVVGQDCIGEGFLQLAPQLEETYTGYCQNNEAAMTRLFDYSSPEASETILNFWKECQSKLTGRTNAWDLSSLIIKPVQRILKYPLLLSQLLKETPELHPDHIRLLEAFNEMSRIAQCINEVKRRKETVEKYVEGKGNVNVIHGISKKFNRGLEELKHATKVVGNTTRDDEYDQIHEKFAEQQTHLVQFTREVQSWLKHVKDMLDKQESLATQFQEVYANETNTDKSVSTPSLASWTNNLKKKPVNNSDSHIARALLNSDGHSYTVREYRKICSILVLDSWKEAESQTKSQIIPLITTLQTRLANPTHLIKKRDSKLLDHDRYKRMTQKTGEKPDKALEESSRAYESLNSALILELPKLTELVREFLMTIVAAFVQIQVRLHQRIVEDLNGIVRLFDVGGRMGIVEEYESRAYENERIGGLISEIQILESWKFNVWREEYSGTESSNGRFNLGVFNKTGSLHKSAESIKTRKPEGEVPGIGKRQSWNNGFQVVSLYKFIAEVEEELEMQEGEVVWIESTSGRNGDTMNADWWYARASDGRAGWIPCNYIQRI